MRADIGLRRAMGVFFLVGATSIFSAEAPAQTTSGPIISTQVATLTTVGNTFYVFLPLVNSGNVAASNVEVTSAMLGTNATKSALPIAVGTMSPNVVTGLNLQFNAAVLVAGQRYLLSVRGKYSSGGATQGFLASRIVSFGAPTIYQLPANPLKVTPILDTTHGATASISAPNGGTITTTGGDGSVFTLTIPPKALLSNEVITMTPIGSISDIPLSGGLVSGVVLEPQGLRLYAPATLTIQSPKNVPVGEQWGFSFDGAGQDFHLYPLAIQSAVSMQIAHFTGFGYGMAPSLGATMEAAVAIQAEHRLEQKLGQLYEEERQSELNGGPGIPQFDSELMGLYQQFYTDVVQPLLDAAFGDDTFTGTAVTTALAWAKVVTILGMSETAPFSTEIQATMATVLNLIVTEYNRAFQRCLAPDGVRPVEGGKMVEANRLLSILGVDASVALPNFRTQLAACLAGPLDLTFDSTMVGHLTSFNNVVLDTNSHVQVNALRMQFDPNALVYFAQGTLEYPSFSGTVHWKPPSFDCGSTFQGHAGLVGAVGEIDANIDVFQLKSVSQIKINLTINPFVTESITLAGQGPNTGCESASIPTSALYLAFFDTVHGTFSNPGAPAIPYPVFIDIPTTLTLAGSIPLLETANETTTITLQEATGP